MVWQIILLSLGILGLGILISLFYILMSDDDFNKASIMAIIIYVVYLIIIGLALMPLGVWKALELLGF